MSLPFGSAKTTLSGRTTSRTINSRFEDMHFNWKDFGAVGNGIANDGPSINAAIQEMYGLGGGNCYGIGQFKTLEQINLGGGPNLGCGRFYGAGKGATTIFGTFDEDYLVNMPHQTNGVGYVGDMSILNFSQFIGTGALRYCQNNDQSIVQNLLLGGMGSLEMGWNIFNTTVTAITSQGNGQMVSPYGSVGGTISGASVRGWREAAGHEIGMTVTGQQSMVIDGVSFEITPTGIIVGQSIFFATKCTITGTNGNKVLTVPANSTLYPPHAATADPIRPGDLIVTSGVDPRLNPEIRINVQLTDLSAGTTGCEQGTYSLTGADGVTINTPQPITIRRDWPAGNYSITGVQTEGTTIGVVLKAAGNGKIEVVGNGGVLTQGCTNQYAGIETGAYACAMYAGILILNAGHATISCGGTGSRVTKAAIMFNGLYTSVSQLTLIGVLGTAADTATTDSAAFIDNGAGTTLVTSAATLSNSNVLHFTGGTIPGSVVAGVPVIDVTATGNIPKNTRVTAVNNGAGTVTLNQNVTNVASGDTIKFCVPSGVAGGVLTVQAVTGVIGRGPDVHAPGLDTVGAPLPKGGAAVAGTGVGTGSNTPMVRDQIGGWNGGNYAQYTLIKADGSAVSLNLGARVFTLPHGKAWGIDNLTGINGINGNTKAGLALINCDNDVALDMHYADLPGQSGVILTTLVEGMEYNIIDSNTATWGATAAGGGSNHVKLRYNGTNWTVVGK